MPQLNVAISGRTYRMACGEGEEAHLEGLAALFDGKITELRGSFGEIGDMRLHVMAALMIADELTEARRTLEALTRETERLRSDVAGIRERGELSDAQAAEAVLKTADRVERLARAFGASLAGSKAPGPNPQTG